MAFLNLLGDSYSVVEHIYFNRSARVLDAAVITYSNHAKKDSLAEFRVAVNIGPNDRRAIAKVATPPAEPQQGDYYLVIDGTGDWAELTGKLLGFNGISWDVIEQELIYLESEDKFYKFDGLTWVEAHTFLTEDKFDSWFGVEAIGGESNLVRQIYLYLKTLPVFHNVQDA